LKGNESGVEGFMRAHPSDKDKDVARMGHPEFLLHDAMWSSIHPRRPKARHLGHPA
jgi:hypothetical protein